MAIAKKYYLLTSVTLTAEASKPDVPTSISMKSTDK